MTQVGCAGILVSDTFCGPIKEIPPEGQLLAVDSIPTKVGGCAANVAIDLAKQGIQVDVAGCLGTDPSAKVLISSLEENGVGCKHIVYSKEYPTSKTIILLVEGQDRRYIHSFGANAAFTVNHIQRDWIKNQQVFYLGGLFLMPSFLPKELLDLLLYCREQGVITVVDVVIPQNKAIPAETLRSLLKAVDYFLPNDDEACALTGLSDPMGQLHQLLQWGANTIMITRGRKGAVVGRGHQYLQAGTYPITPTIDPTGCGDAFSAGVVTGIVLGWDLPKILRYASALGASATRALGTTDGVFTRPEAEEYMKNNDLEIQCGELWE